MMTTWATAETTAITAASSSSATTSTDADVDHTETTAPTRCGDQTCEPDEDVGNCPEDCNVCGDGVVAGGETCDNAVNDAPPYTPKQPKNSACTPECQQVAYCGDGIRNGPELCDEGAIQTSTCEADCRFPVCGDKRLNLFAGETCDDADIIAGDGCSPDCVIERRVFVSSSGLTGDLNFEKYNPDMLVGVPLADARCNAFAADAGLSGAYKAWLSDSFSSPATRFDTTFIGHYRLVSPGAPIIAHSWLDLVDGYLAHPIDADQFGNPVNGNVLTNTAPDGTAASAEHCSAFTANDNSSTTIGQSSAIDATWTSLGPSLCSNSYRIYCFEDP